MSDRRVHLAWINSAGMQPHVLCGTSGTLQATVNPKEVTCRRCLYDLGGRTEADTTIFTVNTARSGRTSINRALDAA